MGLSIDEGVPVDTSNLPNPSAIFFTTTSILSELFDVMFQDRSAMPFAFASADSMM